MQGDISVTCLKRINVFFKDQLGFSQIWGQPFASFLMVRFQNSLFCLTPTLRTSIHPLLLPIYLPQARNS